MSIFWDSRNRRPQVWVFPFFFVIAVLVVVMIFQIPALKKAFFPSAEVPSASQEDQ